MSNIKKIYLVDFENVHDSGINNPESLNKNDSIYIFYTNENDKLSTSTVSGLKKSNCEYELISVPSGDQSLDMHLVSFLGFLIGKHLTEDVSYSIISKDKDYNNIVDYWKNEFGISISRCDTLPSATNNRTVQQTNNKTQIITQKSGKSSNKKSKLKIDIRNAISKIYTGKIPNEVASIVRNHIDDDKPLNAIHNELRNTYSLYSEIYNLIKPIVEKYNKTVETPNSHTTEPTDKKALRADIQQSLKKGNYPAGIYNSVASIVSKHFEETNRKQIIYREIISKYGQKTGLDIYHRIKVHL
ncbi:PIN domain-containing protein [Eubacterium ruminantium]|uniref:PIN domain-containing protein n=1 Tax=Eubacterium ruminantium TaxID=42322 RepID=UPI00156A5D2B|nr:PIN domain-containing protein [Eubacterium ruminantium]